MTDFSRLRCHLVELKQLFNSVRRCLEKLVALHFKLLTAALLSISLLGSNAAEAHMTAPRNFFNPADSDQVQAITKLRGLGFLNNGKSASFSTKVISFGGWSFIFVRFCGFEDDRLCPTVFFRNTISDHTAMGFTLLPGKASMYDVIDTSCAECGPISYYVFEGPVGMSIPVGLSPTGIYLK